MQLGSLAKLERNTVERRKWVGGLPVAFYSAPPVWHRTMAEWRWRARTLMRHEQKKPGYAPELEVSMG